MASFTDDSIVVSKETYQDLLDSEVVVKAHAEVTAKMKERSYSMLIRRNDGDAFADGWLAANHEYQSILLDELAELG